MPARAAYCCVDLPGVRAYEDTPENAGSLLPEILRAMVQDRFIREADRLTAHNPTDVRSVAAPHVGPYGRPELLEIFDELLRR